VNNMKTSEFAAMDKVQLEAKVKELKESLFQLRFQLATGQLQNTMQISATKRDIARALTQLSKSELKEQA
jgi:large subunit ribosomal protein L29